MDPTGQSLLRLLFNEGETICVSPNEFGYHSISLENALSGEVTLLSPNDKVDILHCDSSQLTMVALNPIKGWRKDEFCTAYRSFLIEIDIGSIKDQLGTIAHIGMPHSAQVFSGNKSVHTAVILDEDLPNEKIYRMIAQWIFNIIPMADPKCKNPSRSIRVPGSYRAPKKKQRLISLGKRIRLKELMDWLNKFPHLRPQAKEKKKLPEGQADFSRLSGWARGMLKNGIDFKNRGRNQTFFGLAYDLALAGFSEDQAEQILLERFNEENDFKEKELLITIRSAYKTVEDKN